MRVFATERDGISDGRFGLCSPSLGKVITWPQARGDHREDWSSRRRGTPAAGSGAQRLRGVGDPAGRRPLSAANAAPGCPVAPREPALTKERSTRSSKWLSLPLLEAAAQALKTSGPDSDLRATQDSAQAGLPVCKAHSIFSQNRRNLRTICTYYATPDSLAFLCSRPKRNKSLVFGELSLMKRRASQVVDTPTVHRPLAAYVRSRRCHGDGHGRPRRQLTERPRPAWRRRACRVCPSMPRYAHLKLSCACQGGRASARGAAERSLMGIIGDDGD